MDPYPKQARRPLSSRLVYERLRFARYSQQDAWIDHQTRQEMDPVGLADFFPTVPEATEDMQPSILGVEDPGSEDARPQGLFALLNEVPAPTALADDLDDSGGGPWHPEPLSLDLRRWGQGNGLVRVTVGAECRQDPAALSPLDRSVIGPG